MTGRFRCSGTGSVIRRLTSYRALMMGMGNLGPEGRRRQRMVAGIIVAAMLLAAGAVLLGTVL